MSGWWSLPQAAPVLLRHLMAYSELAAEDLAHSRTALRTRILAGLLALVATLFALVCGCIAIIGAFWDTPHRMAAVFWMIGGFAAIAIVAGIYATNAALSSPKPFASVRREWQTDRVILDRILSGGDNTVQTVDVAHASH